MQSPPTEIRFKDYFNVNLTIRKKENRFQERINYLIDSLIDFYMRRIMGIMEKTCQCTEYSLNILGLAT